MKILIIGNGFDLAHSLPTKYIDFQYFTNKLLKICNSEDAEDGLLTPTANDNDQRKRLEPVKNFILSITNGKNTPDNKEYKIFEDLKSLINGNIWFRWLNKRVMDLGENRVDSEAEISDVIRAMEVISDKLNECERSDNKNFVIFTNKFNGFYETVLKFFFPEAVDINDICIEKIKITMLSDLNKLIRCFEIYLSECIEHIETEQRSPDIYSIHFDKVLSFNYTDTFARLYSESGAPTGYDYLHGKARSDAGTPNNMVLGIDEYLSKEQQHINTMFIEFKKYFQRIHKKNRLQIQTVV